jgi:hypothetical protein
VLHGIDAHRFAASFRESLVGVIGADVVDVSLDVEMQSRMRCEDARDATFLSAPRASPQDAAANRSESPIRSRARDYRRRVLLLQTVACCGTSSSLTG